MGGDIMNTMQILSIIIFIATMVFIMTERVHRMTAALAGAVMMILCGVLTVHSSVGYIDDRQRFARWQDECPRWQALPKIRKLPIPMRAAPSLPRPPCLTRTR